MTSIRALKLAHDAGPPDSVPSRMLDVVVAAERLYDAQEADGPGGMSNVANALFDLDRAVRRLRKARARRARERT